MIWWPQLSSSNMLPKEPFVSTPRVELRDVGLSISTRGEMKHLSLHPSTKSALFLHRLVIQYIIILHIIHEG
jgi:hypothetical protein